MEKKKIGVKDLITIGIFTAFYYVLMFICATLGYIPIFYAFLPAVIPIVCGIPFMLYLTKVKCFGMVSLMGILLGIIMILSGHTYLPLITGVACGIIADLIFMAGKYKSKKLMVVGYAVFSLWLVGTLAPFWVMKSAFESLMLTSMGAEYTTAVFNLFEKLSWTFPITAFLSGIAGAFFGFAVLKKHFKRAGIV